MILESKNMLWLLILAGGVGTFLIRYSFVGILGRTGVPEWGVRLLRFVPPAALAALVVPAVLYRGEDPGLHLGNERLIATLIGIAIAFATNAILLAIVKRDNYTQVAETA